MIFAPELLGLRSAYKASELALFLKGCLGSSQSQCNWPEPGRLWECGELGRGGTLGLILAGTVDCQGAAGKAQGAREQGSWDRDYQLKSCCLTLRRNQSQSKSKGRMSEMEEAGPLGGAYWPDREARGQEDFPLGWDGRGRHFPEI